MVAEAPRLLPSAGGEQHGAEPNEQILRLMQSLGIDAVKTREVSCHLQYIAYILRLGPGFVKYTATLSWVRLGQETVFTVSWKELAALIDRYEPG